MEIVIAKDILKANDQIAEENRLKLDQADVYCVNFLGSPGSGKTTLLEAIAPHITNQSPFGVIEGDLATSRDAERIETLGVPAIQINTGGGCHLDANMVGSALKNLNLNNLDLLFIENVGNLVCPAGFRLGERLRVVVLSVTEGDDKIAKYPTMFSAVNALVVNKIDLLPYLDFDLNKIKSDINVVAPNIDIFSLSAKTGEGAADFAEWLVQKREMTIAAINT